MKSGLFNNFFLVCLLLCLWSCGNSNSGKESAPASQAEKKIDSAAIKYMLLQVRDSLKVLYDDSLVTLDSLTGVRNNSSANNPALDNRIENLKGELEKIFIELEKVEASLK